MGKWILPDREDREMEWHEVTRESMIEHHDSLMIKPIHDCNESSHSESGASFDKDIRLWWFSVDDYIGFGPVSFCPFCGVKLPYEQNDMDAYREKERAREEEVYRKHKELTEHMRNNPEPDRDADEVPKYNPLIKLKSP